VDAKNQLTSVGSISYVYDSNGNVTTETGGAGRTLSYDDENQLTAVVWGSGNYRTEFTYDGRGRMRKKVEKYYSGGQWTVTDTRYYVYDGMRVIQERNSSNVPAVGYTRGNDLSGSLEGAGGIGGLLGRSDTYSGGSFTRHHGYHADGNGNVTALVDSAQASAASYRYDPYGRFLGSSGGMSGANVYRFSSKEWFQNLGLYYYGYRFYDPNLQRWINRDPIGQEGGINLYTFLLNSPSCSINFLGLKSGDSYPSADAAARAALKGICKKCIDNDREYCGLIYTDGTSYSYTEPIEGSPNRCPWQEAEAKVPEKAKTVGGFHCHGARTGDQDGMFSDNDKKKAWVLRQTEYLVTPDKEMWKFTPDPLGGKSAGKTTFMGTCPCK